ncbi:MAG: chemotaxis protein CheW [Leptospirales bacterium]|nr:chemotaxis protein CheW [Leptospirales bacterium]
MKRIGDQSSQERVAAEIAQKFLTFSLGQEDYGIPVAQVAEIVRIEKLIQIPHARGYFMGLMDIRGRVLPVIHLGSRLGIEAEEQPRTPDRAIITVINRRRIGLAVDRVQRVERFPPESIDPGPPSLKSASGRFVTGVGKNGDEFVVLLNLDHLFTDEELSGLFQVGGAVGQAAHIDSTKSV